MKCLRVDKFYPYFDLGCIIKKHDMVFVYFKSYCQYHFVNVYTSKKMVFTTKCQNKQDTENVHLSTFCQRMVSNDFKNVLNDYCQQNCSNVPGSMTTSGFQNYP